MIDFLLIQLRGSRVDNAYIACMKNRTTRRHGPGSKLGSGCVLGKQKKIPGFGYSHHRHLLLFVGIFRDIPCYVVMPGFEWVVFGRAEGCG
jgi:hypothetical protein